MRQPHVKDGPPPSLWWHRRADRHRVIDAYVIQCKRGGPVSKDFKDNIVHWLEDLSRLQNKKAWGKPRTFRFWDIPSYARAVRIEPATLMKRLREMEKIAMRLFPDSVPSSRKRRPPLTPEEKQTIRKRYLAGEDGKALAQEFRIPRSHVGILCQEEKSIRSTERARLMEHQAQTGVVPDVSDSDNPL